LRDLFAARRRRDLFAARRRRDLFAARRRRRCGDAARPNNGLSMRALCDEGVQVRLDK
jgi:hypothetical protein